jgi:Domain of unknown function (DUF4124)
MELLLRLLIISFPFVFVGALFWPVIEDKFVSPVPAVKQLETGDVLALPAQTRRTKSRPENHTSVKTAPSHKEDSGIYRWVDENGRVVFSDRPTNENAVAHTPTEINTIAAVVTPQPRRVASLETPQKAITTQKTQHSSRSPRDFKFPNISAGQKHGHVLLSGRVSQGFRCQRLRITATAASDRGGSIRGYDTIKSRGSGSSLYEIKVRSLWKGNGRRPQWDAGRVSAVCLD